MVIRQSGEKSSDRTMDNNVVRIMNDVFYGLGLRHSLLSVAVDGFRDNQVMRNPMPVAHLEAPGACF